jgi:hypothetical protein
MQPKIRNLQDFWSGIFFAALGLLAIYLSRSYEMGSALAPGPGYFPTWLGGIMTGFGILICVLSFGLTAASGEDQAPEAWGLRPWFVLSAALAVFAVLMDADFGFVPSLVVLIAGAALAHGDVRWRETALLSIFLSAAAVAIFVYGLGMPYRLFWWSA